MQRHVVGRQIMEVTVPDQDWAHQVHNQMSRISRQRIVPLLDRICSELVASDQIVRIQRLEIDLGILEADSLEQDLVSRIGDSVRNALLKELKISTQGERADRAELQEYSHIELLYYYLQQGALPWWADNEQHTVLDDALSFLLTKAPRSVRRLLDKVLRSETQTDRFIETFNDQQIVQTVQLVVDTRSEGNTNLTLLSELLPYAQNACPSISRKQFWAIVLRSAEESKQHTADQPNLYRSILIQLSARSGVPYRSLLVSIVEAARQQSSKLHAVIESLLRFPHSESEPPKRNERPRDHSMDELVALLQGFSEGIPNAERQALLDDIGRLTSMQSSYHERSKAIQRILRSVYTLSQKYPLTPEQNQALSVQTQIWGEIEHTTSDLSFEDELDISFSQMDGISILNAGIVILWPFLPRFFENMGLIEEQQFPSIQARYRATLILHQLVNPETTTHEYLLPLNKVICGLDLASVFEIGPALTESEVTHCSEFLEAVIQQAPILKNMSADGFRGTFLQRRGILRERDGAWLLQVERETYDIVLDHFQWMWQWVKLPWMERALQVEW